jgi:hypothetical protein
MSHGGGSRSSSHLGRFGLVQKIELRPRHGTVFVPDGNPSLPDAEFIARATLALDA